MYVITIVQADDWEGLYIDGSLKLQSHHIDVSDILSLLGIDFEYQSADQNVMDNITVFPDTLSDCRKAKLI